MILPSGQTRTSELPLPPSTGRSCTRATVRPSRAADTAAHVPAMPPPTTTRSNCPPARASRAGRATARRSFAKPGPIVGRHELEVLGEQHRVAAALEAGQVVQRDLGLARRPRPLPPSCQCHAAPSVPKVVASGLPSTSTWNRPGRPAPSTARPNRGCAPRRGIVPADGNLAVGHGVADRIAQPVGQQVRRAHLVHELLVDDPAAAVAEALGLHQQAVGGVERNGTGEQGDEQGERGGLHGDDSGGQAGRLRRRPATAPAAAFMVFDRAAGRKPGGTP